MDETQRMTVLGVDPGQRTGFCVVTYAADGALRVAATSQPETPTLKVTMDAFVLYLGRFYFADEPFLLAIEDYRVYKGQADMHTGKRLYEAEQIGAMRGYVEHVFPPIQVHVLPAQKKGRWPDARIAEWVGRDRLWGTGMVEKPHGWDALKLALTCVEQEGPRWISGLSLAE